ncbi:MAG: hypothetical protein MJZ38_05580 [archaeon]|nr:hypothetical protein [archaeon]
MTTINGFLFMPERWSSNYFENVDVEKDLRRHLTTVPGETINVKRAKVRS